MLTLRFGNDSHLFGQNAMNLIRVRGVGLPTDGGTTSGPAPIPVFENSSTLI